jgi:hypothetical protein
MYLSGSITPGELSIPTHKRKTNTNSLSSLCILEVNKDVNESWATYVWYREKNWQRSTIFSLKLNLSPGTYEIDVRLKYTLLIAFVADWWQKCKSVSLDHNGGRSILSSDKFIFSRTVKSKIFGKQYATAIHTS